MNTASRMSSTCPPGKIHLSEAAAQALLQSGSKPGLPPAGLAVVERGIVSVKGECSALGCPVSHPAFAPSLLLIPLRAHRGPFFRLSTFVESCLSCILLPCSSGPGKGLMLTFFLQDESAPGPEPVPPNLWRLNPHEGLHHPVAPPPAAVVAVAESREIVHPGRSARRPSKSVSRSSLEAITHVVEFLREPSPEKNQTPQHHDRSLATRLGSFALSFAGAEGPSHAAAVAAVHEADGRRGSLPERALEPISGRASGRSKGNSVAAAWERIPGSNSFHFGTSAGCDTAPGVGASALPPRQAPPAGPAISSSSANAASLPGTSAKVAPLTLPHLGEETAPGSVAATAGPPAADGNASAALPRAATAAPPAEVKLVATARVRSLLADDSFPTSPSTQERVDAMCRTMEANFHDAAFSGELDPFWLRFQNPFYEQAFMRRTLAQTVSLLGVMIISLLFSSECYRPAFSAAFWSSMQRSQIASPFFLSVFFCFSHSLKPSPPFPPRSIPRGILAAVQRRHQHNAHSHSRLWGPLAILGRRLGCRRSRGPPLRRH